MSSPHSTISRPHPSNQAASTLCIPNAAIPTEVALEGIVNPVMSLSELTKIELSRKREQVVNTIALWEQIVQSHKALLQCSEAQLSSWRAELRATEEKEMRLAEIFPAPATETPSLFTGQITSPGSANGDSRARTDTSGENNSSHSQSRMTPRDRKPETPSSSGGYLRDNGVTARRANGRYIPPRFCTRGSRGRRGTRGGSLRGASTPRGSGRIKRPTRGLRAPKGFRTGGAAQGGRSSDGDSDYQPGNSQKRKKKKTPVHQRKGLGQSGSPHKSLAVTESEVFSESEAKFTESESSTESESLIENEVFSESEAKFTESEASTESTESDLSEA